MTTLTIASLNLHCGLGWRGEPFDVAAAIRALDSDVICLQEVWLPAIRETPADDSVAAAARRLGAALYRVPLRSGISLAEFGVAEPWGADAAVADGSRTGDLCLALLTTLPATDYEVRPLGRAPGDRGPRLAQIICLRLASEASIRIVNTHLTHRLTSPVQLGRLWRYLRPHPGPTIIAGDLNMPRLIAARLAGFSPAVSGRTWPAWQPLMQLDHLLVSRDTGAAAGSVLPSAGSDHLPVRAAIAVAGRAQPKTADNA